MKIKLTYHQINGLQQICEERINLLKRGIQSANPYEAKDGDMLLIATLEELERKIAMVAIETKKEYRLKLKPAWAFALRICFAGELPVNTYMGATMMQICNEAHQLFQIQNPF